MRVTQIISAIIVSTSACFADCLPNQSELSGTLKFVDYRPSVVKTTEVLDTRSNTQEQRLDYLRSHGHICARVQGTKFKCTKVDNFKKFEDLTQAIQKEFRNKSITFENKNAVEMVNDAPALTQWRVRQSGSYMGKRFEAFDYLKTRTLSKIKLPGNHWLNVWSCTNVSKTYEYRVKVHNQSFSYYAQIDFKN